MAFHPSPSQELRGAIVVAGVLASLCVAPPSAFAAGRVGAATSIDESVTGSLGGRPFVVSAGDDVRLQETVQTDSFGQARLLLVDDTDVAILSRSTMTIERYAPGSKLVSTPDGTFLVHTGHGTAGEPRFDTSAGTLTPQGTRFWFEVRGGRIKLDVQEGAVRFCPRGKSHDFCVLATPGHNVLGSAGAPAQVLGMAGLPPPPPPPPPGYPSRIGYPPTGGYPGPGGANGGSRNPCPGIANCGCARPNYFRGGGGCGTRAEGPPTRGGGTYPGVGAGHSKWPPVYSTGGYGGGALQRVGRPAWPVRGGFNMGGAGYLR